MCDLAELADRFADQIEILELFVDAASGQSTKQVEREWMQQARREDIRRETVRLCVARWRSKRRRGVTVRERKCPRCGRAFPVVIGMPGRRRVYCGRGCRQGSYERRVRCK